MNKNIKPEIRDGNLEYALCVISEEKIDGVTYKEQKYAFDNPEVILGNYEKLSKRYTIGWQLKYIGESNIDTIKIECKNEKQGLPVVSLFRLFDGIKARIIDIRDMDVSNVIVCSDTFTNVEVEEIWMDTWNTKNICDFSSAFYNAKIGKIDLSKLDVSNAIDMSNMFMQCQCKTLNISNWDTRNVVNMESMFYSVYTDKLDLSRWNTSNVMYASDLFYSCSVNEINMAGMEFHNTILDNAFDSSIIGKLNLSGMMLNNVNIIELCRNATIKVVDFRYIELVDIKSCYDVFCDLECELLLIDSIEEEMITDMYIQHIKNGLIVADYMEEIVLEELSNSDFVAIDNIEDVESIHKVSSLTEFNKFYYVGELPDYLM